MFIFSFNKKAETSPHIIREILGLLAKAHWLMAGSPRSPLSQLVTTLPRLYELVLAGPFILNHDHFFRKLPFPAEEDFVSFDPIMEVFQPYLF
jgi:hypothetical protein